MEKGHTNRLLALEGLRGLAAISVVFYHVLFAFLPAILFSSQDSPLHYPFEDTLYKTPLTVFVSGTFAVAIFFVLSGFVLSIGFFQTRDTSIIKKLATKRYFRLMLPALAAIMLAWLLLSLGFGFSQQANQLLHNAWVGGIYNFTPGFMDALYNGFVFIFTTNASAYDPVTWTMVWEFGGSFIVFITCLLVGTSNRRWIAYALLIFFTFQTWNLGFVIGMIMADLYANRQQIFHTNKLGYVLFIVGLLLGAYPLASTAGTIYQTVVLGGDLAWLTPQLALILGATLMIFAILSTPKLHGWFSRKRISGLGKYTYSLYLIHLPILFTLGLGLFVLLSHHTHLGYAATVSISVTIDLVVTAGATYLFERFIDVPATKFAGLFAKLVLAKTQSTTRPAKR